MNIDRRSFLKASFGIGGLMLCNTFDSWAFDTNGSKGLRFGLVTDAHFARRDESGTRFYLQSAEKLKEAIKVFNESKMDFIIELGDFKDQDIKPDKQQTLTYLDEIESIFQSFQGHAYHVLGNHDMDSLSKADFLKHTRNPGKANGKAFYSFVRRGIKCIVLDANYNEDRTHYDQGNFNWTKAFIPASEMHWLENELNCKYPVVVFLHQLLDSFSDIHKNVCVGNAAEIVKILEYRNNVLAVFQGHHHSGHYSFRNGIHYFTLKGMIEGPISENNSFAIVNIDPLLNITIKGFRNCEDKQMDRLSLQPEIK